MRLTVFSDYSLRLMMFAASHEDRLVTIEEVAQTFGISRSHLMKVANLLTRSGFLKAVRGRSGGLSLTRPIDSIRLGDIVRATELARKMVCEYGMSGLGPLTYGKKEQEVFLGRDLAQARDYSDDTAKQIDVAVRQFVDEGYRSAYKILQDNADIMHRMSNALLERETEIEKFLEQFRRSLRVIHSLCHGLSSYPVNVLIKDI